MGVFFSSFLIGSAFPCSSVFALFSCSCSAFAASLIHKISCSPAGRVVISLFPCLSVNFIIYIIEIIIFHCSCPIMNFDQLTFTTYWTVVFGSLKTSPISQRFAHPRPCLCPKGDWVSFPIKKGVKITSPPRMPCA